MEEKKLVRFYGEQVKTLLHHLIYYYDKEQVTYVEDLYNSIYGSDFVGRTELCKALGLPEDVSIQKQIKALCTNALSQHGLTVKNMYWHPVRQGYIEPVCYLEFEDFQILDFHELMRQLNEIRPLSEVKAAKKLTYLLLTANTIPTKSVSEYCTIQLQQILAFKNCKVNFIGKYIPNIQTDAHLRVQSYGVIEFDTYKTAEQVEIILADLYHIGELDCYLPRELEVDANQTYMQLVVPMNSFAHLLRDALQVSESAPILMCEDVFLASEDLSEYDYHIKEEPVFRVNCIARDTFGAFEPFEFMQLGLNPNDYTSQTEDTYPKNILLSKAFAK